MGRTNRIAGRMLRAHSAPAATALPEVEPRALELLRNRVLRIVPSEPWREHLVHLIIKRKVQLKTRQAQEFERVGYFPPGGASTTLMVHCRTCGGQRWIPPQYVNNDELCADCFEAARAPKERQPRQLPDDPRCRQRIFMDRDGAIWGQTWPAEEPVEPAPELPPFAAALEAMAASGTAIVELPLMTEDARVLARQIARHESGEMPFPTE